MLAITGLKKTFRLDRGFVEALRGIDLALAQGEFFVLLGPSGCGKTTMLRSVAGLERPEAGEIAIDGGTVVSGARGQFVPPERRPIAMVFQSYAVWPHMDVYENIAFPLREGVRQLARDHVDQRVRSVLALLGLEGMAERAVTTLSGGQQQRVALARALALQPKVLLMDEPLSNLDLKLQMRLRGELKELMHRLAMTTLYVTHNQGEALEMGDRIAVMDRGRIVQIGAPAELYRTPRHEFVARFIGEMNLIEGRVVETGAAQATVETALGAFAAAPPDGERFARGERCFVGIRPEDVGIAAADAAAAEGNATEATVSEVRFLGEGLAYACRAGAETIKVKAHRSLDLAPGRRVHLRLPAEYSILVRPAEDGEDMEEAGLGEGGAPLLAGAAG